MKKLFILYFLSLVLIKAFPQANKIDSIKYALASAKDDISRIILLDSLSRKYVFQNPDGGVKFAQQGFALGRKINYEKKESEILWNLAFSHSNLGDYTEALRYWYQSISAALKLRDTISLFWAYGGMANTYRDMADYSNAKKNIDEARRLADASNNKVLKMLCDRVESFILVETDHLDSALFYIKRAMAVEDWDYGSYISGLIYGKLGQDSLALKFIRKAIPTALQTNDQKDLIDYYNGILQLFFKEGNTDSAIHYSNLILQTNSGRSHRIGALHASALLAEIYGNQKKSDSAIKYLKLTIALNDSLFSQQKTREAQSFAYNEQLHQQELQQQLARANLAYRNRLNIYFLLAGLVILIIVAGGLWRRNIYKQKSYVLLQKQKQETDFQKSKVEETLEELKSTQAQLIQSEKMASLGELTAGIAHEIQNPLNFVNNFSDVSTELIDEMKSELAKGNQQEAMEIADDLKQNLEKINHHGKRAGDIVKGMLQHSRTSTGKKEPTDINKLADEYLRLSYHGLRAKDKDFNATMKTDFDTNIEKINIIPQDIRRVLLNLFNNAFYACTERSRSTMNDTLRQAQGDIHYEPTVSVSTKRINDKIEIKVGDNGNGIPKNIVDKIFQPFFTTKPTGQGTGLGLSLTYDIIKAHGGEIKVETKEGEGSTFMIQLTI